LKEHLEYYGGTVRYKGEHEKVLILLEIVFSNGICLKLFFRKHWSKQKQQKIRILRGNLRFPVMY